MGMREPGEAVMPVGVFVQAIKRHVEGVPQWRRVALRGECTGVQRSAAGHWYFELRDAAARIRCAVWAADAAGLAVPPAEGLAVIATGAPRVWERDGQVTFAVRVLEPEGRGAREAALAALALRLLREGLLDRPKRPLPRLPAWIGVVTSDAGAAIRDVEAVAGRRFPGLRVRVFPARVQGDQAVPALLAALDAAYAARPPVLLVGRGGGSRADLEAFDAEPVLRKVAAALQAHHRQQRARGASALRRQIDAAAGALAAVRRPDPDRLLAAWQLAQRRRRERWRAQAVRQFLAPGQAVARLRVGWEAWPDRRMAGEDRRIAALRAHARALNPAAVLARGYAWVEDAAGQVVATARAPGGPITIRWGDGARRALLLDEEA